MSVKLVVITVMRMQSVQIPLVASAVLVTLDILEMEHFAVSLISIRLFELNYSQKDVS